VHLKSFYEPQRLRAFVAKQTNKFAQQLTTMKSTTRQSAILLLSDGNIFHGESIGISEAIFG
jgi:hypothetical protein